MNLILEVKFKGGLGNQLFQYATARNLSIKSKTSYLLLNTESYAIDGAGRSFGLLNFQIEGSLLKGGIAGKIFWKGAKVNKLISYFPFYKSIEEEGLKLHFLPDRLPLMASLKGYWQSDFYFRSIRDILVRELKPKERPGFPDWKKMQNTVAVHIRRTDYLVENGFGFLNRQYYEEAISLIRSKIDKPHFIFFSDDLTWCKENFSDPDFLFCDEPQWDKDYLQLFLMSTCDHQIIANSSFSWWAGWLNPRPDKLVIRPEKPFLDDSLMYESYYPAEWLSIKN